MGALTVDPGPLPRRAVAVLASSAALCGFFGGADVQAQSPALVLSSNSRIGLNEAAGNRRSQTRTVKLATQPTANVTVAVTVADTTVATVTPASLQFTTSNWNTAQTVTFTAVDDDVDNSKGTLGQPGYVNWRTTRATFSASGGGYNSVSRGVNVLVSDDDQRRFQQRDHTPGRAREGGTVQNTIWLATEPTDDVTVTQTISDPTLLRADPATVKFTPENWKTRVVITYTAIENDVDEDPNTRKVTVTYALSGGDYDGIASDSPTTIHVMDDDNRGLDARYSVTVLETGSTTVPLKLESEPTDAVTVTLSVADKTVATVSPATVRFTPSNWSEAVDVTVAAVDDDISNPKGIRTTRVNFAASGGDYEGETHSLRVRVWDDEPRPVTMPEGGTATRTLGAVVRPGETRVLLVTSSDPDVVSVSPGKLTWTPQNSGQKQTVTLTAVDNDDLGDGAATVTYAWTKRDDRFDIRPDAVTVTDNDAASVIISPTALSVGFGLGAFYAVALSSKPTGTVTVTATSEAPGVATVHQGQQEGGKSVTLEFGPENWDRPWNVAAYGQSKGSTTFTHTVSGGGYDGVSVDSVAVTVTDPPADDVPKVRLSAEPNPVPEGQSVTVTATLSRATSEAVTIPLRVTDGTAEADDHGPAGSITVPAGKTTATLTLRTFADRDGDDETFTVALGALPPEVAEGNPPSVDMTIDDGSGTTPPPPPPPPLGNPSVSLSARPNPHVREGVPVEVTATLSRALSVAVTIPLRLVPGTAEPDDYGSLPSITIPAGGTSGTGILTTVHDADEDDETLDLVLGTLPPEVAQGNPSSVDLTILDRDGADSPSPPPPPPPPPGGNHPPTVRVSCAPLRVAPGGGVRLTAAASDPDGDPLTYAWSTRSGRFDGPTDRPSARWTAPAAKGRVTIRVRVRDGEGGSAAAACTVEVFNRAPAFGASVYRFELAENRDGRRSPVDLGAVMAKDPDGDALTYEVAAGAGERFRVGSGDGAVLYVGPGEDYEAEPNRFSLTVRARDASGAEAEARVVVAVSDVNERPAAADDAAETAEDEPVTVDVLANDTDPDGDGLRVVRVSRPAHGTARMAAGGGVRYVPAANYHGTDRFTYSVSDGAGLTAEAAVEVTVLSVNDAPVAVGAIPDQPLDEGGGGAELDLAPYFEDADGDALRYRAASSDADVVAVAVSGALLTLTPVTHGTAAVTVTAEDPGGLTAAQTFSVGVDDRLVRAVLGDTLASMARSHLASARMTLGRRVTAGGGSGSRLTLMGRPVPLGKAEARTAAAEMLTGWLSGLAWPGAAAPGLSGRYGQAGMAPGLAGPAGVGFGAPPPGGGFGGPRWGAPAAVGMSPAAWSGLSGYGAGGVQGMPPTAELSRAGSGAAPLEGGMRSGAAGGMHGLGGFAAGADALLRSSEFEMTWGGGEGGERRSGRRWRVWGQGDVQAFQGAPTLLGHDAQYDGELWTGYAGVDASLSERWLAGVAVARSSGVGDWRVGSSSGRLRATLTALHPYVQWSDGATSVWALAGGGRGGWGEAGNRREATGRVGDTALGLRLGLVEVRRRLGAPGGTGFGLRADAAWAELRTGDGDESVDRQRAAVNQVRVGADVARAFKLGGLSLGPFGEAHLRRDGGAGQTGTGVELVGGLRAQGGPLRIDAQARTLAVHSAAGYRERGAGLTLGVGDPGGEGLALSVSPRWGDQAAGGGALWQDQIYRRYLPAAAEQQWTLDAQGSYGMRLPGGGLLSWFGSYSRQSYDGGRLLFGGSIGGPPSAPPTGQ